MLGVVEVDRHGDDSVLDLFTEIYLGCLSHLDQHHGGDLLRHELLLLAFMLHNDHWPFVITCDDFEKATT